MGVVFNTCIVSIDVIVSVVVIIFFFVLSFFLGSLGIGITLRGLLLVLETVLSDSILVKSLAVGVGFCFSCNNFLLVFSGFLVCGLRICMVVLPVACPPSIGLVVHPASLSSSSNTVFLFGLSGLKSISSLTLVSGFFITFVGFLFGIKPSENFIMPTMFEYFCGLRSSDF